MEYDGDGSETGSAVSDEELDGNPDIPDHQHNVEIILDEDGESDDTDETEDESMSDESLGDSALYSDEMQVIDEAGEDPGWHDESGIQMAHSTGRTSQQGSHRRELRTGMPSSFSRIDSNSNPYLDGMLEINDAIGFGASTEQLVSANGIGHSNNDGVVPNASHNEHELSLRRLNSIDGGHNANTGVDNDENNDDHDAHDDDDDNDNDDNEDDDDDDEVDDDEDDDVAQHEWDWNAARIGTEIHTRGNSQIANRVWATLASNSRTSLPRPGFDSDIQIFRRPRSSGLLEVNSNYSATLSNPVLSRPTTTTVPDPSQSDHFSHWIESIEALIGGGAVQLIGDIMRRPASSGRSRVDGAAIRLELPGAESRSTIPAQMQQLLRPPLGMSSRTQPLGNDPVTAVTFHPTLSLRRYQDEASIIFARGTNDHVSTIVTCILEVMQPITQSESMPETTHGEIDRSNPSFEVLAPDEDTSQPINPLDVASTPNRTNARTSRSPEQVLASEPQRESVHRDVVHLRGQDIDVTGFGIDMEFLDALPEDMREEVLTQHIRERRAAVRVTQEPMPDLSPEFLEALPAEIRAELVQQEAHNRSHLGQVETSAITSGQAADIDTASFLASLDPALRRAILAEQDDEFLEQLPRGMVSEIVNIQYPIRQESNEVQQISQRSQSRPESGNIVQGAATPLSPSKKADSVQLLDRQGIAALLRLLFQASPPQRNMLHDVLLNLCANRYTRMEILTQLVSLTIDSTDDTSSVERCLHNLHRRSKLAVSGDTPMKTPKRMYSNVSMISVSPSLFVFQCLQALSFLVTWNEQIPSFFLTEQESVFLRKTNKAKGKLKDYHVKAWKYPINAVMTMLDRSYVLEDSDLLEPLALLISSITRPLLLLLRRRPAVAATLVKSQPTTLEQHPPVAEYQIQQPENAATTAIVTNGHNVSRQRELVAPEVAKDSLQFVVNLVTADACSGKTFQHTLAAIYHLSVLENAKSIISEELVRQGKGFVSTIERDLDELTNHIKLLERSDDLKRIAMAKFASGNSDQAKFLRVLKTIDYLHDEVHAKARADYLQTSTTDQARHWTTCQTLYHALCAAGIWSRLSTCLSVIHLKQDITNVATLLLPLIEALLVVCKNSSKEARTQPAAEFADAGHDLHLLFITFTDEHKKVLNQMVRNNPGLMSGSFALLTKNPRVLEFDNKRNYFNRRLRDKSHQKEQYSTIQLHVRREAVFLDSYKDLHFKSGNEIKYSKLNIRFAGEEGVDAGGVSREWFQVLARQMFDPNYALFVPVNADRNTYHPNKTSGINPEHLLFFKFIGRIVGKALYDGRLLDCHFSKPIYCNMLGKNVALKDMETLDLEYYNSLLWMLNNDITDVITESFSVERDDFGVMNIIDLIPNGRNVAVTEQNKQEYITRVTEYRLLESVADQLKHFMIGFNEIIPAELVSIFTEQELELLISGLPDIDPDDWKNNTEYQNYTAGSAQIQWFWRAVRSFDDEERARLLQFCTGSSRIPIEGFAHLEGMHGVQKFNIHRDYSPGARLPQSHTCFNQLDLPEYENYDILRTSILIAISEGNEGFGFA